MIRVPSGSIKSRGKLAPRDSATRQCRPKIRVWGSLPRDSSTQPSRYQQVHSHVCVAGCMRSLIYRNKLLYRPVSTTVRHHGQPHFTSGLLTRASFMRVTLSRWSQRLFNPRCLCVRVRVFVCRVALYRD